MTHGYLEFLTSLRELLDQARRMTQALDALAERLDRTREIRRVLRAAGLLQRR